MITKIANLNDQIRRVENRIKRLQEEKARLRRARNDALRELGKQLQKGGLIWKEDMQ